MIELIIFVISSIMLVSILSMWQSYLEKTQQIKPILQGLKDQYRSNLHFLKAIEKGETPNLSELCRSPEGKIEVYVICYYYSPEMAIKMIKASLAVSCFFRTK